MITYLRNKLYRRTKFARQTWVPNNKSFCSNKFSEFNIEYRKYGNRNPNKFFYVIKRSPGAGFYSNLGFVIHHLLICEELKMIPVVDMENYQTFYNCKIKINGSNNSWNYYFEPVSKYSLDEVYKSQNVLICDEKTSEKKFSLKTYESNLKYLNGIQYLDKRHKKIFKKYIKIKKEIVKEAEIIYRNFKNKKVIGICYRGSDSKLNAYQPHTPTKKQMIYGTELLLKKYNFNKIYVCTEDQNNLNFYKKKYSNKIIYNESPRTTDKRDLFDYPEKNHRYKIGRGNLIDMIVLSKTDHILFGVSAIPYMAMFFANKKIRHSIIDNGIKGGIFISQISFFVRKNLPSFLGGFKNALIIKNKIIKPKKSDFSII